LISPIILDTDVVSFLAKADTRAALYSPALIDTTPCVCFQTVAELRLWALVRRWGSSRRSAFDLLLEQYVVLPYDSSMAEYWATVTAHRRSIGRPIDCGDAWIAAAAIRHRATLLTHNAKDFEDIPELNIVSHRS